MKDERLGAKIESAPSAWQDLVPFGIDGLPAEAARPFTEKNGTRGTLVYDRRGTEHLRRPSLSAFATPDSFREERLASGKVVRGSGHAVIFADMLKAVVRDVPRAVVLSLLMTHEPRCLGDLPERAVQSLAVLFALARWEQGVGAFLYLAHVRINFLNFAALPITFGIGVDYAVNVAQRYYADARGGRWDAVHALRTSGGAVVLCSLTTMLGYLALLGSHNQAIRSLGLIAVVGEMSCLLAAVVILPALWLSSRRADAAELARQPSTQEAHGAA